MMQFQVVSKGSFRSKDEGPIREAGFELRSACKNLPTNCPANSLGRAGSTGDSGAKALRQGHSHGVAEGGQCSEDAKITSGSEGQLRQMRRGQAARGAAPAPRRVSWMLRTSRTGLMF